MNTPTMNTPTPKKRTVTLTGKPPVTFTEADWPIIGHADAHNGREFESDATRKWKVKVRQHADKRLLVYGVYTTQWQGEHDVDSGYLVREDDPDTLTDTITRVCREIAGDGFSGTAARLAQECIASLPPADLDPAAPPAPTELDKVIAQYNEAILRVVKAFQGAGPMAGTEFREGLRLKEYEALRDLNVLRVDFGGS